MAVGKKITDLTASGSLKDTNLAIIHDGKGTKRSTLTQLSEYMGTKFSNPNLLINPDFKINQRGQESYTISGFEYTVDRWRISGCTVSVSDNGLTIQNVDSSGSWISQKFEKELKGVFTLSVKVSSISGKVHLTNSDNSVIITSAGIHSTTLSGLSEFNMFVETGSSVTFEWAKLEKGSIATPFVAPNPTEELMKCQRYYKAFSAWKEVFTFRGDDKLILVTIPECPMRINPSLNSPKITVMGLQTGEIGDAYARYNKDIALSYTNLSNGNVICFASITGSIFINGGTAILQDNLTLDAEVY